VEHHRETRIRMKAETKPGRVRIIGELYRRTPIPVIAAPGLRPTPDRVRETVFNWLEHLMGTLAGAAVLDLFAGSGALGFEAASRGAGRVVMVDSHARAVEALQALQRRLGASAVEVLQADWRSVIARLAPASFDLVFLDPPFGSDLLPQALTAVRRILRPEGLIYVESGQPHGAGALPGAGLELVRSGKAGVVQFQLLRAPAQ